MRPEGEGTGPVLGSTVKFGFIDPMCPNRDVLCGFLLCVNISGAPRLGDLGGDISSVTFYHQGKELDCRCRLGPWLGQDRGEEGTTVTGTRGQGLRLAVPSSLQGRPRAAS